MPVVRKRRMRVGLNFWQYFASLSEVFFEVLIEVFLKLKETRK